LAKDRQALPASIERILTRDIRRGVMAHGDPVEIDNPAMLRAALAPLLARSPGYGESVTEPASSAIS
jgi:hypothetical protein